MLDRGSEKCLSHWSNQSLSASTISTPQSTPRSYGSSYSCSSRDSTSPNSSEQSCNGMLRYITINKHVYMYILSTLWRGTFAMGFIVQVRRTSLREVWVRTPSLMIRHSSFHWPSLGFSRVRAIWTRFIVNLNLITSLSPVLRQRCQGMWKHNQRQREPRPPHHTMHLHRPHSSICLQLRLQLRGTRRCWRSELLDTKLEIFTNPNMQVYIWFLI